MKIGLAVYEFQNNNPEFNIAQIEKALRTAQGKVDLLCFGEAFLQGFDALTWNYDRDRHTAVSQDSETMRGLCRMSAAYGTDLLFGYIEEAGDSIYSSCALVEGGRLTHNYRRISRGWKEYKITDGHYKEGSAVREFCYRGRQVKIALCGDLWDYPEKFRTEGLLIWPIYVNFSLEDWARYKAEYGRQAGLAAKKVLLVNAISRNPRSHGGAFCFAGGQIEKQWPFDRQGILTVEA